MIDARVALSGRREAALLDLPSVRRMAETLAARCREPSWVRTSVASLDRFATMTDNHDLEVLLQRARVDPTEADRALHAFGHALASYTDTQIAALTMGPKIWFRLNGVDIAWRPISQAGSRTPLVPAQRRTLDRLVLLTLIGSGLHLAELLRLRIGDVGSIDEDGRIVPDLEAEPLAVRYTPRRGKRGERITFVSFHAREALLAELDDRRTQGLPLDLDAPLIARRDGRPATVGTVAYARRRNQALIKAGNYVNVTMCRATGDFFRTWGMPGSRFQAPQEPVQTSGS
jgi:hypothetical protein